MDLVAQDKLDAAIAQQFGDLTDERKQQLVHHLRSVHPERARELHKIFIENLPVNELAFYNAIVIPPQEEGPAGAVAATQPQTPTPSPESAVIQEPEGAAGAKSEAARSRSR